VLLGHSGLVSTLQLCQTTTSEGRLACDRSVVCAARCRSLCRLLVHCTSCRKLRCDGRSEHGDACHCANDVVCVDAHHLCHLSQSVIQIHDGCSETSSCRQCSCCCFDCSTCADTTSMLLQTSFRLRACSVSLVAFPTLRRAIAVQSLRRQHRQPVRRCTHPSTMPAAAQQTFFLDEFAHKQFNDVNPDYSGTRIYFDSADFVARIQQYHDDGRELIGGYAPFCKHIFVPNFTGARLGSLVITQENRHLLRSAYSRRRPEELPVLSRHAPNLTAETCRLIVRPNRLTAPS